MLGAVTAATATVNTVGRRWRCPFRYGPGLVGTLGEESRPPVGALSAVELCGGGRGGVFSEAEAALAGAAQAGTAPAGTDSGRELVQGWS